MIGAFPRQVAGAIGRSGRTHAGIISRNGAERMARTDLWQAGILAKCRRLDFSVNGLHRPATYWMMAINAVGDLEDVPVSDATLVRGALDGDKAAFAELYDRYAGLIRAVCYDRIRDVAGACSVTGVSPVPCAVHSPPASGMSKRRCWD